MSHHFQKQGFRRHLTDEHLYRSVRSRACNPPLSTRLQPSVRDRPATVSEARPSPLVQEGAHDPACPPSQYPLRALRRQTRCGAAPPSDSGKASRRQGRGSDSIAATGTHNHCGDPPGAISEEPIWRYSQSRKRRSERHFSGHVGHVHGPQAERLRSELAGVLEELLDWAAQRQRDDLSTEGGAAA